MPLFALPPGAHGQRHDRADRRIRGGRPRAPGAPGPLPDENPHRALSFALDAALAAGRDNPLWVKVTQEDGHVAWSSPIYVIGG